MREIVSPLSGIRSPFGQRRDLYKVLGFKPGFVADFGAEYYRATARTTFANTITSVATSNATMTDSDGLLKWRPHNLLTYSEDFSNAAWNKASSSTIDANVAHAPDGSITADRINFAADTNSRAEQIVTTTATDYTFSVWLRSESGTVTLTLRNAGADFTDIDVGETWALYTHVFTETDTSAFISIKNRDATARSILSWGAHVYRSDLGGMVDNPDRGDSYVPTTSAAVYLPRRNHHVWDGSAWVNEGLLHESEARTNLCTASNELDAGNWTVRNTNSLTFTANQTTGPDGNTSLGSLTITDTANEDHGTAVVTTLAADTDYTLSAKVKDIDQRFVSLWLYGASNHWAVAVFDLQTGTVTDTQTGATSGTITGTFVEDLSGGLYRISMAAQVADVNATEQFGLCFVSSGTPTLSTNGLEAYTGVAGVGVYAGFVDLEAGSTPSSHMPTNGSTATRAAETLTIPSANLPWPTPRVIGDELWNTPTISDPAVWSWDGSTLTGTGDGTSDTATGDAVTAGGLYSVSFTVGAAGAGLFQVRLGSTFIATLGGGANQTYSYTVVATDTTGLRFTDTGSTTAVIDNISVREIDPLAVSIQMEGQVTYVDNDSSVEAEFCRWENDASNTIRSFLRTNSTNTGRVEFRQIESGTTDSVTSAEEAYSPGILVPFNIASRHGATFVNGAVDGTALTANTTPVALPDLSATDLELGYEFMGTIKTFRIWADDIGDAGIAEASS